METKSTDGDKQLPKCGNCEDATVQLQCQMCEHPLTFVCRDCYLAIHKPVKFHRHRALVVPEQNARNLFAAINQIRENESAKWLPGRCNRCAAKCTPKSLLNCKQCRLSLCLACDRSQHQVAPTHIRTFHDSASLARSSEAFTVRGVRADLIVVDEMESYAGIVWLGSKVLAHFVDSLSLSGKRVLELGCGVAALPSLAAAAAGAREVVATDINEDALAVLSENVDRFSKAWFASAAAGASSSAIDTLELKSATATEIKAETKADAKADAKTEAALPRLPVTTRPLAFGSDTSKLGAFDAILGAYIMYDFDVCELLAQTIAELSGPDTVAFLTSDEPTREKHFVEALESFGLQCTRVSFKTPLSERPLATVLRVVRDPTATAKGKAEAKSASGSAVQAARATAGAGDSKRQSGAGAGAGAAPLPAEAMARMIAMAEAKPDSNSFVFRTTTTKAVPAAAASAGDAGAGTAGAGAAAAALDGRTEGKQS